MVGEVLPAPGVIRLVCLVAAPRRVGGFKVADRRNHLDAAGLCLPAVPAAAAATSKDLPRARCREILCDRVV